LASNVTGSKNEYQLIQSGRPYSQPRKLIRERRSTSFQWQNTELPNIGRFLGYLSKWQLTPDTSPKSDDTKNPKTHTSIQTKSHQKPW